MYIEKLAHEIAQINCFSGLNTASSESAASLLDYQINSHLVAIEAELHTLQAALETSKKIQCVGGRVPSMLMLHRSPPILAAHVPTY
jgi:hypothetical protein